MMPADENRHEHRLVIAGSGGQGVLTVGKLLCTAAIREGKSVTYLPSYGAEVRGGTANCQSVISSGTIYSPLVEQADSLIILNQPSYDRFLPVLRPEGLLIVNSTGVEMDADPPPAGCRALSAPAAGIAAELGNVKVGNMVLLGAFVQTTGIVEEDNCRTVLREVLGQRRADLLDLNIEAFRRGCELAGKFAG
jgi:2-oxoglutarate ferredoxin oxidoreductase subunit gamma